jgi:hypothetical protein
MTTASAETAAVPSSLRANRDFQVVLVGQAVSAFGDAITLTAMPLLVLFLIGSGALLSGRLSTAGIGLRVLASGVVIGAALLAMGGVLIGASLLFGLSKTLREAGRMVR